MSERLAYKDGYTRVDSNGEYITPCISLLAAHTLKQTVIDNFLLPLNAKVPSLESVPGQDNHHPEFSVFRGVKTRSIPNADFLNDKSIFTGVFLRQYSEETWKMRIVNNRMVSQENGYDEQRLKTSYLVMCIGSQLVEASRTVKYVRSESPNPEYYDDLEWEKPTGEPAYKRVGFTKPIVANDVAIISTLLNRQVARAKSG